MLEARKGRLVSPQLAGKLVSMASRGGKGWTLREIVIKKFDKAR